ncbi:MAG: DUF362 domain-containing protein [Patescibacteria group bacterium]|nr:DUF362 domain-containing protein [Patescibacteria group bacterium]
MNKPVVKIEVVKGKSLKNSVRDTIAKLCGLEQCVKAGEKVLLKPNFNTADPFPASSDIEFIKAVIELLLENDVGEIILGDSCTFSQNTRKVMERKGAFALAGKYKKLKVVSFDEGKWVRKEIPNGRFLKCVHIPEILEQVDRIILLPCLKTHFVAQYTGALKLAVGFMKPIQRLKLHMGKVQEKIAELNTFFTPDLVIMDARKCFINKGPSDGEIREPNLVLASTSRVEVDIEGVGIIQGFEGNSLGGVKPEELPQIKRAMELGIDSNSRKL